MRTIHNPCGIFILHLFTLTLAGNMVKCGVEENVIQCENENQSNSIEETNKKEILYTEILNEEYQDLVTNYKLNCKHPRNCFFSVSFCF